MKSKKRSPVFLIVFLAALAVFIVTTIKLATIFLGYQKEDSVYKELEQFAEVDPADTADTPHYNSPIDFESLWEINQETIASTTRLSRAKMTISICTMDFTRKRIIAGVFLWTQRQRRISPAKILLSMAII